RDETPDRGLRLRNRMPRMRGTRWQYGTICQDRCAANPRPAAGPYSAVRTGSTFHRGRAALLIMDSSKLTDRLRGILKTPASRPETVVSEKVSPAIERVLGGAWEGEDGHRA